jgi:hypothetical protein
MITTERYLDVRLSVAPSMPNRHAGGRYMSRPPSPSSPDPLPLRWAVIFTGALVASLLMGTLTFVQTGLWPATLLAALTAAGVTVPALHAILGSEDGRRR